MNRFLSYLGSCGVQPPIASWGTLIAEGVGQINSVRIYWWLIIFPAGILVIHTAAALNFVGDGLRDAWDIKMRLKIGWRWDCERRVDTRH